MKTQRGNSGTAALLFGAKYVWVVNVTPQSLYCPEKNPAPILQQTGWVQFRSGQVWNISSPTGIRFPDYSARNESLYSLSYPGALCIILIHQIYVYSVRNI